MSAAQIVWLRRDLRLADQPALYAAAQAGPVRSTAANAHTPAGTSRVVLATDRPSAISVAVTGPAADART